MLNLQMSFTVKMIVWIGTDQMKCKQLKFVLIGG